MAVEKILKLCADNPGLRVECSRVGDRLLIVFSRLCGCDPKKRLLLHESHFMHVEEFKVVPEVAEFVLDELLVRSKAALESHTHDDNAKATTRGVRVRS
jgi:hypothetical protein